jgi:hypothetical protein
VEVDGEEVIRYRGTIIRRTPAAPTIESQELAPQEENEESLVRYRGSFIRPASEAAQSSAASTPPSENLVRYRGSLIPSAGASSLELSPNPSDQPIGAEAIESEAENNPVTQPRRRKRRDGGGASYNYRAARPFRP